MTGILDGSIETGVGIVEQNPLGAIAGAAGLGAATGLVTGAIIGSTITRKNTRNKSSSSRKKRSRIKHTKRGLKQDRARRSKEPWEIAYQKRKIKNRSSKRKGRIYYAKKTGQPYIILSNGRAKFIKGKRRKR